MSSRILGSVLRPIFGTNLCSIMDDHVIDGRSYTIVGVTADQADTVAQHSTVAYRDWRIRVKIASTQNYRGPSIRGMPPPPDLRLRPPMATTSLRTAEEGGRKKARKNKERDSSSSEEQEETPKRKKSKGQIIPHAPHPAYYQSVPAYPSPAYPPTSPWSAPAPPAALPQPSP